MAKKKDSSPGSIADAVNDMNSLLGASTVQNFEDGTDHDVVCIDSGSIALNYALGGGYAQGRIIEIFGPESSGKTTLTIEAAKQVQELGMAVLFLDLENAFDPAYGEAIGLDYSKDKWIFSQPDCGEDAFTILEKFVGVPDIGLIIVDSIAAMVPRAEIEGEYGESKMGLHARLMSQGMRKLVGMIKKSNTTVMFINQTRDKIGVMFGSPETTPGGNAMKFYASQRLRVGRRKGTKTKDGELMSNLIKVDIRKNKIAPPHRIAEFQIRFGEGIDSISELIAYAVEYDVIQQKGAFFSFEGTNIGQGAENARTTLLDNPDLCDIIKQKVDEI